MQAHNILATGHNSLKSNRRKDFQEPKQKLAGLVNNKYIHSDLHDASKVESRISRYTQTKSPYF
jgi:hypothetical protein